MCNIKLPVDLTKDTDYSTKRIKVKIKSHQDDGWLPLIIIILGFVKKLLLEIRQKAKFDVSK